MSDHMIRKSQRGFTLIEVLVSTLVLSVGIMGVAAMQMVSFQTNQSAYARSQAIYLAQDMFDRMRANPAGYQTTTVYNSIDTGEANDLPSSPNCVTSTAGCTPQQMAQQDAREWAQHFTNIADAGDYRPTLPGGRGVILRTASSNIFTATVSWNERDFDAEGNLTRTLNSRSITIQTELN